MALRRTHQGRKRSAITRSRLTRRPLPAMGLSAPHASRRPFLAALQVSTGSGKRRLFPPLLVLAVEVVHHEPEERTLSHRQNRELDSIVCKEEVHYDGEHNNDGIQGNALCDRCPMTHDVASAPSAPVVARTQPWLTGVPSSLTLPRPHPNSRKSVARLRRLASVRTSSSLSLLCSGEADGSRRETEHPQWERKIEQHRGCKIGRTCHQEPRGRDGGHPQHEDERRAVHAIQESHCASLPASTAAAELNEERKGVGAYKAGIGAVRYLQPPPCSPEDLAGGKRSPAGLHLGVW